MSSLIDQLLNRLHQQGGVVADFGPLICIEAGIVLHRDPFDRLIAATARRGSLPLVSADPVFDGIVPSV